jgi:large subunit ribosomal protein L27
MLGRSLTSLGQPALGVVAALCGCRLSPMVGLRFATSKGGGSTRNGRDSLPKFLGVKCFGGHWVEPGNIIVRQRGARFGLVESTATVGMGRDHTIFALVPGFVKFWHNARRGKNYVEVVRSAPGVEPVQQYPISHIRGSWDLEQLDRLCDRAAAAGGPAPAMAEGVAKALQAFRSSRVVRKPAVEAGGRTAALAAAAAAAQAPKQQAAQLA